MYVTLISMYTGDWLDDVAHTYIHWLTHSHMPTGSLTLTCPQAHSLSHAHRLTHSHMPTGSLTLTCPQAHSLSHAHRLTHSHIPTGSLTLTCPQAHSLSHAHRLTHSHMPTGSLTLTCPQAHIHVCVYRSHWYVLIIQRPGEFDHTKAAPPSPRKHKNYKRKHKVRDRSEYVLSSYLELYRVLVNTIVE